MEVSNPSHSLLESSTSTSDQPDDIVSIPKANVENAVTDSLPIQSSNTPDGLESTQSNTNSLDNSIENELENSIGQRVRPKTSRGQRTMIDSREGLFKESKDFSLIDKKVTFDLDVENPSSFSFIESTDVLQDCISKII